MYELYVALLIVFLKIINVQSEDNNPASTSSFHILPLILINLGKSCIKPDKIETIQKMDDSGDFGGKTKLSAAKEPAGQQVFMCATQDFFDTKPSNVKKDCLYSMKFHEWDILKCTHEPMPTINKYILRTGKITLNDVLCGPKKSGRIYRLVYKICMTDEPNPKEKQRMSIFNPDVISNWNIGPITYESEIEIYRICYSNEKGLFYTEHTISSLELLKDERLQQEREKTFPVIYDPSNPFNFTVETMKKDYDRWSAPKIEEDKVSDSRAPTSSVTKNQITSYQQKQLVPPGDFSLALWSKAAYSFFNFRRMRTDLVALWDHISFLIRQNAIELNREYHIHTSVFKLALTQQTPVNKRPFPEPNIWMKKIYYLYDEPKGLYNLERVKAVAILINGYFDTDIPEATEMLRKRCTINICRGVFTNKFPVKRKAIRCCSLIENTDLQEEGVEVHEDLEIDFLRIESQMRIKKDEPSNMDQDALLSESNKRKETSSSYNPQKKIKIRIRKRNP